MTRPYGIRNLVKHLAGPLQAGQTLLLYGPVGGGKTTLLEALAGAMKKAGRPCGFSRCTRCLCDIAEALLAAYPRVRREGRTLRQIRSDLILAVESHPGVLLLDHLHDVGTQFKGYLRTLRGTGLGVLLTADAENPRDHLQLRALHLAYQELRMPRLASHYLHRLLAESMAASPLPFALMQTDESALIRMAHGRPGWIALACRLLHEQHYWRNGRVLRESLRAEIMTLTAGIYFRHDTSCDLKAINRGKANPQTRIFLYKESEERISP